MRRARLALWFLGALLPAWGAPSLAELAGTDPFSLVSSVVSSAGPVALSLQDSRVAAGTRALLAEDLDGRRVDQLLRIRPSGEAGWSSLVVGDTARVLELQAAGEAVVLLAEPSNRDGQKWRLEPDSQGRYRVSSKLGLVLGATRGARPLLTASAATVSTSATVEQRWTVRLHPVVLSDDGGGRSGGAAERYPTLARQLQVNRESWLDGSLAARRLDDYLTGADAELWKGMSLVLRDRVYALAPEERNYAFTLLLWLLTQGAYARGDTISVALALANASIYAAGDEEVRAALRRDLPAHYKLYRAVTEWQGGWAIDYRLAELPLMAKVLWCYRSNQLEQSGARLTLDEYETFVDRIDVLEQMHELVRSRDVSEASSLRGIVLNLDALFRVSYRYAHFMGMIRQWYTPDAPLPEKPTDDELYAYLTRPEVARLLPDWVHDVLEDYRNGTYYVEVLGRRRDPQARMWVNYQWQLYLNSGIFRGDCGTEAEVSMALWKSAGLVAMAIYHTGKDIGHAYPVYYDPFVKRFLTLQDFSYMAPKYGASAEVTFHPMPLRIHDGVPFLSPRPVTEVGRYSRFVSRGFDYALMERLYLDRGFASGAEVFTVSSAPETLPDSDHDGLRDADEIAHGTRPDGADTDGDGFADLWEIERGLDPRNAASPSKADLARILVGHVVRIVSALSGISLEPAPPAAMPNGSSGTNGSSAVSGPGRRVYRIVRSDDPQYHFIVAADTGLSLGVGERGRLLESPLSGAASQKWKLIFRDAGTFLIQSRVDGSVIALPGGQEPVVRPSRSTAAEVWVIR